MTIEEAAQRLLAHIQSNPYGSGPNTYWPAEDALKEHSSRLPLALLADYYAKVQSVMPEVPPALEGRSLEAFSAWAAAAAKRDDIVWNRVLLDYWQQQPEKLAHGFDLLRRAWAADSDPEPDPALVTAAQDPKLTDALKKHLGVECVTPYPTGWVAILILEGRAELLQPVRAFIAAQTSELLNDVMLDRLHRLCSVQTLSLTSQLLLAEIETALLARDDATGQNDLFRDLSRELPRLFQFACSFSAKNGDVLELYAHRRWDSSAVWWNLSIGKKKPGFIANPNGTLSNRLGLPRVHLGQLREWIRDVASHRKTTWKGPLKVEEEGFDPPLLSALEAYFGDLLTPPAKAKPKPKLKARPTAKAKGRSLSE